MHTPLMLSIIKTLFTAPHRYRFVDEIETECSNCAKQQGYTFEERVEQPIVSIVGDT